MCASVMWPYRRVRGSRTSASTAVGLADVRHQLGVEVVLRAAGTGTETRTKRVSSSPSLRSECGTPIGISP